MKCLSLRIDAFVWHESRMCKRGLMRSSAVEASTQEKCHMVYNVRLVVNDYSKQSVEMMIGNNYRCDINR